MYVSSQSSMGLLHSPAARAVKLPIHEKSTTLCTCCTNYYLLTNNLKDNCESVHNVKKILYPTV
jgi:hypothetical protein